MEEMVKIDERLSKLETRLAVYDERWLWTKRIGYTLLVLFALLYISRIVSVVINALF